MCWRLRMSRQSKWAVASFRFFLEVPDDVDRGWLVGIRLSVVSSCLGTFSM